MNEEKDVTRRTHLAAERTWLAWWRTGLAVIAVAIGIGRVTPALLHSDRVAFAGLGVCYAVLALGTFYAGFSRFHRTRKALREGSFDELGGGWVAAFAFAGGLLAILTLALIVTQG